MSHHKSRALQDMFSVGAFKGTFYNQSSSSSNKVNSCKLKLFVNEFKESIVFCISPFLLAVHCDKKLQYPCILNVNLTTYKDNIHTQLHQCLVTKYASR